MRWKSIIWTVLGLIVLLGIAWLVNFLWLRPVNIEDFYERIVYDQAEVNSEFFIQLPPNNRDHFSPFRIEFHNRTQDFYQNRGNLAREQLTDLKTYPTKYLSKSELISYRGISHFLSQQIVAAQYAAQYQLIESLNPVDDPIFFLLYTQPVKNTEQAKTYTTRLRAIKESYNQITNGLKDCESKGILPPKSLVEAKINQLKMILASSPDRHPLYLTYAKKLVRISRMEITEYEQIDYLKAAEKRIQGDIFPACEQFLAYLEELLPKTSENFSTNFWGENGGFHQHQLNSYLGQGFSPQEVHEKGKVAVQELQKKREALVNNQEAFGQSYALDSIPNDSVLAIYLNDFHSKMEESGFKWAGILGTDIPRNIEMNVLSRAFSQIAFFYHPEEFTAKTQAQLYLNPRQISSLNMLDVFTYTIPGKHYLTHQLIRNDTLSLFSRMIHETALQNGWLIYSQHLADEYGFLAQEPKHQIAYLNKQLLYAGLLVVDSGLFSQNWSMDEAMTYLQEAIGLGKPEAEVWLNRILANPGKYTTYWMGYKRILALRERAKSVQGLRFNIADFHQWMIKHQTISLNDIGPFFEDYLNSPTP